MTDFNTALNTFIAAVQSGFDAQNVKMAANFPEGYYKPVTLEPGRKFIRVVSTSGTSRSVYCFVDATNGDVLKAAGWKAPAKGARANIYKPESFELAKADCYTGWLYAR